MDTLHMSGCGVAAPELSRMPVTLAPVDFEVACHLLRPSWPTLVTTPPFTVQLDHERS